MHILTPIWLVRWWSSNILDNMLFVSTLQLVIFLFQMGWKHESRVWFQSIAKTHGLPKVKIYLERWFCLGLNISNLLPIKQNAPLMMKFGQIFLDVKKEPLWSFFSTVNGGLLKRFCGIISSKLWWTGKEYHEMARNFRFDPEYCNRIKLYSTKGFVVTAADVKCSNCSEKGKTTQKRALSLLLWQCVSPPEPSKKMFDWSFPPGIVLNNQRSQLDFESIYFLAQDETCFF